MPISGRIAVGAQDALNEVLERRLKEATRQQIERQAAADNALRQQGIDVQRETLASAKADREADNALNQKRFDLEDLRYREGADERATNRNRASDMAGVLAMPGMSDAAKAQEISGLGMKAGNVDPSKVIEGLTKKPTMHPYVYTNPKTGIKETRFYDANNPPANLDMGDDPQRPTAGAREPMIKVVRNGKPAMIRESEFNSETDKFYDAVFERGQAKTEMVHPQLIKYSENLIRKIDDLIGRDDDPATKGVDEKKGTRISNWTTGVGGAAMRMMPWNTEAKDVDAELFSLTSELAIAALQKMRASSSTGGAVGNVALGEMEIMKNAEAAIRADQSPTNLQRQLGIIRNSEAKFLEAVRQDAEEKAKEGGITVAPGGAPPAPGGPPAGKKETPQERYRRLLNGG